MKQGGLKAKVIMAICKLMETGIAEVTVPIIQRELLKGPEIEPPAYMTVATVVSRLEGAGLLIRRLGKSATGGQKKHYYSPQFDLDQIRLKAVESVLNDYFSGEVEALKATTLKIKPQTLESGNTGDCQ